MNPARCDRSCFRGATYTHTLTFTDGAPIDLTDRTWTATAWPVGSPQSPVCTFTVDDTDAATGVLVLSLTAAQTSVLSGKFRWALVGTGTEVEAPVGGVFLVSDDAVTIGSTSDATTVTYTPESTTVTVTGYATRNAGGIEADAWVSEATGYLDGLRMRKGHLLIGSSDRDHTDNLNSWGTHFPADAQTTAFHYRATTVDNIDYLPHMTDTFDIEAASGFCFVATCRAVRRAINAATPQHYFAQMRSLDTEEVLTPGPAGRLFRDGLVYVDWVDGGGTSWFMAFGPAGDHRMAFDTHGLCVYARDLGDGTALVGAEVRVDPEAGSTWVPLRPAPWQTDQPGVTLSANGYALIVDTGETVAIAGSTVPFSLGYGRGPFQMSELRHAPAATIGTASGADTVAPDSGTLVARFDPDEAWAERAAISADRAYTDPRDVTWVIPMNVNVGNTVVNPTGPGWMLQAGVTEFTLDDPVTSLPQPGDGDWSMLWHGNVNDAGFQAYVLASTDYAASDGWGFYSYLGSIFAVMCGTQRAEVSATVDNDDHVFAVVRGGGTLTLYVDGEVADTATSTGEVVEVSDVVLGHGVTEPGYLYEHGFMVAERAWTVGEVTALTESRLA